MYAAPSHIYYEKESLWLPPSCGYQSLCTTKHISTRNVCLPIRKHYRHSQEMNSKVLLSFLPFLFPCPPLPPKPDPPFSLLILPVFLLDLDLLLFAQIIFYFQNTRKRGLSAGSETKRTNSRSFFDLERVD